MLWEGLETMEIGIYRSRQSQFHVSDDQRYQRPSTPISTGKRTSCPVLLVLMPTLVVLLKHQQTATLYATPSNKTSLGKTEGKKKKKLEKEKEKKKNKNKNKRKEIVLLTMLMLWIHFHNSPTRQIQPVWDSYPNPNYHSNYSNVVDDGFLSSLLWPRYWSCQWTTSSSAVPILMLFAMSTSGQCPAPKTPELGDSWSQFCRLKNG